MRRQEITPELRAHLARYRELSDRVEALIARWPRLTDEARTRKTELTHELNDTLREVGGYVPGSTLKDILRGAIHFLEGEDAFGEEVPNRDKIDRLIEAILKD
ncbi:hypothetical protein DRH29_02850 [candidate division Kazan bacterium]|uniref:Uncharacterized protein n=1 Tax=candidate division Kazan bacterium TaxID=2202143 RepID=A0A420ZCM5_UNCK3|nr:MAG: hypothetical protein DRH29_02850 [candidate division Kazan bacterium]